MRKITILSNVLYIASPLVIHISWGRDIEQINPYIEDVYSRKRNRWCIIGLLLSTGAVYDPNQVTCYTVNQQILACYYIWRIACFR